MTDPHTNMPLAYAGHDLNGARCAVILLNGRGSSEEDILGLAETFYDERIAFLAPQAANRTWYPYSFLAPVEENEPWLPSAIERVESLIDSCVAAGIQRSSIVVCGFSQGACLATEFIARHPAHYGALIAFTGGLVGPSDLELQHEGSLTGTRALLSSGDPDSHVSRSRVEASARELGRMGARVELMRYAGRPHTIVDKELEAARSLIFSPL
ncbi:alpha/beta hydrolase [Acidicapsa acidisoli]|uniref:alpha/beta hydrolase n=1 Tax=Acidicapsa acidisoli TaxID=1615681 RepID=UPI0021DFF8FC|nr:dienelactone hydrolase family protein [Acidicapsa acidisoli]